MERRKPRSVPTPQLETELKKKSECGLRQEEPASSVAVLLSEFRRFWADEEGQGTIEYVLILAFTVIGSSALVRAVVEALDRGVLTIGAALETDLKTGRLPVNFW